MKITLIAFSFFVIVFISISEANGNININMPRVLPTLDSMKIRVPNLAIPTQPQQYTRNSTTTYIKGIFKGFQAYDYYKGSYYSYSEYSNPHPIFEWYLWNGTITKYYIAGGKSLWDIEACSCRIIHDRIPTQYTFYVDPNATLEDSYCKTTDQQIGDELWVVRRFSDVNSWCLKGNKLLEETYIMPNKKFYTITYNNYNYQAPPDHYFHLPTMCHLAECS